MAKDEPTAPTVIQMPVEMFQQLLASLPKPGDGASAELTAAIRGIEATAKATALLQSEVQRTVRRSNAHHPNKSAFTFDPRCETCKSGAIHEETGDLGHPKAKLRHKTYFCYGLQREDQLTPVEIELFNQFTESKEARDGAWTATIERGSSASQRALHVNVPAKSIDDLASLPPALTQILVELLYGQTVSDPVLSMERIRDLERRLSEMEAKAGAGSKPLAGAAK